MSAPELNAADLNLQAILLDNHLLTAQQMRQSLAAREQAWQKIQRQFVGLFFRFQAGELLIQEYGSETIRARFPAAEQATESALFEPPAQLYLSPESGQLQESAFLALEQTGLLLTSKGTYLITSDPQDCQLLGSTQSWLGDPHCDLYLFPKNNLLIYTEREAGLLHLIELQSCSLVQTHAIREPGLKLSINVCAHPQSGDLWLTDQHSSRLGRIDPRTYALSWHQLPYERLGQIAISEQNYQLYLLTLAPQFSLLCLDAKTLERQSELELQGRPLSASSQISFDNLLILADSQDLAITAEAPTGELFLQVIQARLMRVFETYPLPQLRGAVQAMSGQRNPLLNWYNKRLEDWAIELGFIRAESLLRLRHDERLDRVVAEDQIYTVPEGNESPFEMLQRPAPLIRFANDAAELVLEMMMQSFKLEHGHDLREHDRELERLQRQADKVVSDLESQYVALVEITHLLKDYSLQMVLTREALLRALDLHLGGKTLPFRPTLKCPLCCRSLQQARCCEGCGFQLDNPAWQDRRAQQSVEAFNELIPGQMVLALPHVRQIAHLDAWLQVIQEWRGKDDFLVKPQHVLALPNQHWLVCDPAARKVLELDSEGEIVRLLDHAFEAPVMSSFRRKNDQLELILVLDKHQVLGFTAEGRLAEVWGSAEGLELQNPCDLQWTWAQTFLICEPERATVREWDPLSQLPVLSWGSEQGLKRPVMARRQLNGDYLIVDAGQGKILFFNEAQLQVREVTYWPPPGLEKALVGQSAPDRFLVLPNGDLLALGRRYWMQIQLALGKVRWVQPWTGERRPEQQKSLLEAMAQEDESLKRLRQFKVLERAETPALEGLQTALEAVTVSHGEWIVKPDDLSGTLYFIFEGEVEIVRPLEDGSEQGLAVLHANTLFGEIPLILSETYPAGFRAVISEERPLIVKALRRSQFKTVITRFIGLTPQLRELAFQRKALLHQYRSDKQQVIMDKVKTQLIVNKLEPLAIFAGANASFLEDLAERMHPLACMPQQQIFGQGEAGDTLYFIGRGSVGVYLDQSEQAIQTLRVGDVFGEIALLYGQARTATVRTDSYCQLYELDSASFNLALLAYPEFKPRLEQLAQQRQQDLASARERLQQQAQAPTNQGQAEIFQLQTVRPAQAFHVSKRFERVVGIDENGRFLWCSSSREGVKLHRPTRLSQFQEKLWIADTGNQRVVQISSVNGLFIKAIGGPQLDLNQPRSVTATGDGRLLIADTGNQRVILISESGDLLWEYTSPHEIMSPWYAELTPKGTVLFCDRELQMVFEIEPRSKSTVWSYGQMLVTGSEAGELNEPSCVRRLSNGATLILDTGNDRLLLMSPVGKLMRTFEGNTEIALTRPMHAEILSNGEMLIYPENEDAIVRLGMSGQPVWAALLPTL